MGVNDIRRLPFPPPTPPGGRGVFGQALLFMRKKACLKVLCKNKLTFLHKKVVLVHGSKACDKIRGLAHPRGDFSVYFTTE